MTTSKMLVNMPSPVLDEYYPAIVISTLMRILRDPTLQQHHTSVVQAVTFIFQSLGIKLLHSLLGEFIITSLMFGKHFT
jgi:serine/threonine-protein kinase mTOR